MGSKKNSKIAGKAQFSSLRDVEADEFNEYASKQSVEEENKYERASDIDFDADYSDEEMEIKFKNQREVITYLHNLEDDNLFKVGVNQADEETLEQTKAASKK